MATKAGHGPGAAYQRGGFAGVWKYAKGHGLKRWLKAKHWAGRRLEHALPANKQKFRKAEEAYAKKVAYLKAHQDPKPTGGGGYLVPFDGHTVPRWIVEILQAARASGIWKGSVISGYRSPEYSTSLCENMCGAPSCPGHCAGASSNHSCPPTHTGVPYEGAADVSDYYGLEGYCRSHNAPLYGGGYALPSDLPHFSNSGR